MGQVVSFAGLCKLTILRMNMILPKPSEAGSAMLRYSMSQEGSLSTIGSVKSFMPSVSTLTPGKTHGSGGGSCVQGDGVTALQAGASPQGGGGNGARAVLWRGVGERGGEVVGPFADPRAKAASGVADDQAAVLVRGGVVEVKRFPLPFATPAKPASADGGVALDG